MQSDKNAESNEPKAVEQSRPVLDHGFVRLIDWMGSDLSVVRSARVSYDAAWRTGENEGSDHKLIHYLWKNKHLTPFESVEFQFEVKAPIFVFRQWHRHRTWSYNELSARYRPLPNEYYVPDMDAIGHQSTSNKQGRDLVTPTDKHLYTGCLQDLVKHCDSAYFMYSNLLSIGWPRELARMVLPVNFYSHMFAKVNLRNLLAFLDLRCDSHAQFEIRQYADAMRDLAAAVAPVCMAAWGASK